MKLETRKEMMKVKGRTTRLSVLVMVVAFLSSSVVAFADVNAAKVVTKVDGFTGCRLRTFP